MFYVYVYTKLHERIFVISSSDFNQIQEKVESLSKLDYVAFCEIREKRYKLDYTKNYKYVGVFTL